MSLFGPNELLQSYNITTFDDALIYINSNIIQLITKMRIIDCALIVYGSSIKSVDYALVDLYIDVMKTYWIDDIFNTITIPNKHHFIEKYITPQIIYDMLNVYISGEKWGHTRSHNHNIRLFMINYIMKLFIIK